MSRFWLTLAFGFYKTYAAQVKEPWRNFKRQGRIFFVWSSVAFTLHVSQEHIKNCSVTMPTPLMASLYHSFFRAQQDCIRALTSSPKEDTVLPSRLMKLTARGNVQLKDLVEEVWLRDRLAKMLAAWAPSPSPNIIPPIRTSLISFQYTNNPPLKNEKKKNISAFVAARVLCGHNFSVVLASGVLLHDQSVPFFTVAKFTCVLLGRLP